MPTPKVSDFGIAKRGRAPDLTQTGVAMGTPAYMSPEQARGETKFVGPGADVYALGVILYECLTGTVPFDGTDPMTVLHRVMHDEPPAPRKTAPHVPPDLELICLKCLQKLPHERYASAAALADDLAKFAAGEPVSVRPPGVLEKAVKWARRHPTRATAYALTLLVAGLSAVAAGALVLGWRAEEARREAVAARDAATADRHRADEQKERAVQAQAEADRERGKAEAARGDADYVSAVRAVDLALREYEVDNPARARELLDSCPARFRAWEWRYVDRLVARQFRVFKVPGRPTTAGAVAITADGKWLAVAGGSEPLHIWNVETGAVRTLPGPALSVAPAPGGQFALITQTGTITLVDPHTGTAGANFPLAAQSYESHPDAKRALLRRDVWLNGAHRLEVVMWNFATGAAEREFRWPSGYPIVARLSPTGDRVAVAGLHIDHEIVQGKENPTPDCRVAVRVFDTATGRELATALGADPGHMLALAWSADGTRLVTGSSTGRVKVWDAATAKCVRECGVGRDVYSVGFSPDGARVVSGGADRTARVWEVTTGRQIEVFRGHSLPVRVARFAPDGAVLTAGDDGTVRFWRVAATPSEVTLQKPMIVTARVAVSDDGWHLVTVASDTAQVWDTRTGAAVATTVLPGQVRHLALAPAGTAITTVSRDGVGREWLWQSGELRAATGARAGNVAAVSGDRVVCRTYGSTVVADRATGAVVALVGTHAGEPKATALSADGKWVVTGGDDGTARLWDAATGAELRRFPGHTTPLTALALSPDGTRLVTAGREGWLKVWDTRTGLEVMTVRGPAQDVWALGWSANGSKLVAVGFTTARIFDADPPAK